MTTITLPWPAVALTPHARGHWRPKAKATKAARAEAHWLAKAAGVKPNPNAVLRVTYHPPDRAKRDCANMHGRLKAALDGIADAMGVDDNGFRVIFPSEFAAVKKGGEVIITVDAPE